MGQIRAEENKKWVYGILRMMVRMLAIRLMILALTLASAPVPKAGS